MAIIGHALPAKAYDFLTLPECKFATTITFINNHNHQNSSLEALQSKSNGTLREEKANSI
jgi:hypothetical protein